jgi:hypothetical protein
MNFMRPANGVGADLGKPDMADVSCLHHLGDGADRLLDGDVGIKPGRAIDIDIVGAEAAEGISEEGLHCRRPRVIAEPISGDVAQRAELDADHDGRAVAALKCFIDQHLVVAHSIEVTAVEQIDSGIERGVDGRDALAAVAGAIKVGHAHAAEADGRDFGTRGAKLLTNHQIASEA